MTVRSFKHIGRFVKNGRMKHPQLYSQNQLSKLLGYKNGQFISNVERGLCGIPLKGIQKLIEVLGLDRTELKNAMLRDYEDTIDSFLNARAEMTLDNSDSNSLSEHSQL